jgi:lambda family phage portal protein
LHVFPVERAGQARGPSQLAAAILPLKDFDDYEDATLVKQRVAACLGLVTTDADGTAPALGGTDSTKPEQDLLEPGMILNLPPGRSVATVNPPSVNEHGPYTITVLRKVAAALPAVSYESLVGDFSQVNFSSARMARLVEWDDVEDFRWLMLVPQFCDPVWRWFREAASVLRLPGVDANARVEWTAPPMPFIEPNQEGDAYQKLMRNGLVTWPEAVRERGYNPTRQLREIEQWNKKCDAAGVKLDCDPRHLSAQGQATTNGAKTAAAAATVNGKATNGVPA